MNKCRILSCRCRHAFQDMRYGTGKRVHNEVNKAKTVTFRCTVCGSEKEPSAQDTVSESPSG